MKKIFFVFGFILAGTAAFAAVPENKFQLKKEQAAFEETLLKIPVYREKIQGEIVGPVHAEDMLTNKKDAMVRQMRFQAYKMGANAISEFKCNPILKSLFISCEGFAVIQ